MRGGEGLMRCVEPSVAEIQFGRGNNEEIKADQEHGRAGGLRRGDGRSGL